MIHSILLKRYHLLLQMNQHLFNCNPLPHFILSNTSDCNINVMINISDHMILCQDWSASKFQSILRAPLLSDAPKRDPRPQIVMTTPFRSWLKIISLPMQIIPNKTRCLFQTDYPSTNRNPWRDEMSRSQESGRITLLKRGSAQLFRDETKRPCLFEDQWSQDFVWRSFDRWCEWFDVFKGRCWL